MTSLSRNARIAGLLYLILLTAPLCLIYIPSKLFVAGNASATANNIAAHVRPEQADGSSFLAVIAQAIGGSWQKSWKALEHLLFLAACFSMNS